MKISIDKQACVWLHRFVNQMIVAARKTGNEDIERVARKMRYKFDGAPTVIFLTAKERKLVHDLVTFRLESLQTQPTEEHAMLKQIKETIHVA